MDFREAWANGEIEAGTLLDEIERLRAELGTAVAAERERLLSTLTRHDWHSSSIWRHYYPSATGDWVSLQELRKLLDPPNAALSGQACCIKPAPER